MFEMLQCMSPLMALNGHFGCRNKCPLMTESGHWPSARVPTHWALVSSEKLIAGYWIASCDVCVIDYDYQMGTQTPH
jgi:hypothetical protein